jgi:hypothetical protein
VFLARYYYVYEKKEGEMGGASVGEKCMQTFGRKT